jgi:putative transposase
MMIDIIGQAQKVRIYPTNEQKRQLAGAMGCCRWCNCPLNKSIETYKETGKDLSRSGLNAMLPLLKKECEWLQTEVYSQSLQQTSLNLSHICPNCLTQTPKMDLSIREWICLNELCGKTHDRDEAASRNIRAEGIRILKTDGTAVSEAWRDCKTKSRTKDSWFGKTRVKLETTSSYELG